MTRGTLPLRMKMSGSYATHRLMTACAMPKKTGSATSRMYVAEPKAAESSQ